MSSKTPIPSSGSYYLSPEECQELFGPISSTPWRLDIPDSHKQILEERIAQYCETGVEFTPFEEFEKELFELLRKG